jgi:hypothetical protein
MKNIWKWILGIALVLVLFFGPTLFRLAFPTLGYGYGMMGYGRLGNHRADCAGRCLVGEQHQKFQNRSGKGMPLVREAGPGGLENLPTLRE